jgi:phosphoribosylcarboxyaminoimidazole (NCAIR) mutase
MRELGMKQRVFGSHRTVGDELVKLAGDAAEGFEAVYPYDPARDDARWREFKARYEAQFQESPDHFAALAYDAMQALLKAIGRAGLNRGRIRDALTAVESYNGVTGNMVFDPNCKNVSPMFLATVHQGNITYRPISMEKPYARVGEDGVTYSGPTLADQNASEVGIAVFGPHADQAVQNDAVKAYLQNISGTRHYSLVPIASESSWGSASTALVKAIYEKHVLGVIALDRNASHLAEQIGTKAFVPVIAISSDRMLTSTNIPWIFRLPPGASLREGLEILMNASQTAGPNRERIRSLLASGTEVAGFRFDSTGEPK